MTRTCRSRPMIAIPLTRGKTALVDDQDAYLAEYKWRVVTPKAFNHYAVRQVNGRTVYMHRVILSDAPMVDHVNGDGLDNRRQNLRPATHEGQMRNTRRRKIGTSAFKGVSFDKGYRRKPWRAQLWAGSVYLSRYFATEQDAAQQYDKWARQYHGSFAAPNH